MMLRLLPVLTVAAATQTLGIAQSHWITLLDASGPTAVVKTFDEAQPQLGATTFLADVEFVGIDKTLRTPLSDVDFTISRRVERQGLEMIETPAGAKVLHYRRAGASVYGYLLVLPNGRPVVLDERGAIGGNDPYETWIGVAGAGDHAVFTTGAEVIVARLDGQVFASTGTPSRTLTLPNFELVETPSITPAAAHVFCVSDAGRVYRCAYADGSLLQDITPVTAEVDPEADDELALSRDGSSVVFLYGPHHNESLWFARDDNAPVRLPPPAAKYEEAGYLPGTPNGPFLLLDDDGSQLMYVDSTVRDEAFVLETAGPASIHFTSDANFQPYIGVTILPTFYTGKLAIAVGDPNALDWFRVDASAGTVTNISQTGAGTMTPFDTGTLTPLLGARFADGTLISYELQQVAPTRLQAMDPAAGSTLWAMPRTLTDAPRMGSSLGGTPRLKLASQEGDLLFDAATASPTLMTPPGIELSTEIVEPSGAFSLLVAKLTAGPSALLLKTPNRLVQISGALPILEQVSLTELGGALLDTGTIRYVRAGTDVVLGAGGQQVVILSGASN